MVKARIDWGSQGYSEKYLVELIPGEPAAALFNIAAWAKEVTPTERILGSGKFEATVVRHLVPRSFIR